jgi:hypothetical protein
VKRLLPVLLLLACNPHLPELEALDVALDKQLAEKKAIADNLNEFRRETDRLERELELASAELDAGLPSPLPAAADETGSVGPMPLPPLSMFEGESSRKLRARIDETRHRIAELDKVIGEVKGINRRNAELYRQLELLNELRRAKKQTAPAP